MGVERIGAGLQGILAGLEEERWMFSARQI